MSVETHFEKYMVECLCVLVVHAVLCYMHISLLQAQELKAKMEESKELQDNLRMQERVRRRISMDYRVREAVRCC